MSATFDIVGIPPVPPVLAPGRGAGGPAPRAIIVSYAFWIFLLSDIVMFSALFAGYAVLAPNTAGGPAPRDLFSVGNAAAETLCLLFSSYACALMILALSRTNRAGVYGAAAATLILGGGFLSLEIGEFDGLVAEGAGPSRSAFLSSFFALVGLHGLHVTVGLAWLLFTVAEIAIKGRRPYVLRRAHCFSLFWHALDIIWVAILTLVYLVGTR